MWIHHCSQLTPSLLLAQMCSLLSEGSILEVLLDGHHVVFIMCWAPKNCVVLGCGSWSFPSGFFSLLVGGRISQGRMKQMGKGGGLQARKMSVCKWRGPHASIHSAPCARDALRGQATCLGHMAEGSSSLPRATKQTLLLLREPELLWSVQF